MSVTYSFRIIFTVLSQMVAGAGCRGLGIEAAISATSLPRLKYMWTIVRFSCTLSGLPPGGRVVGVPSRSKRNRLCARSAKMRERTAVICHEKPQYRPGELTFNVAVGFLRACMRGGVHDLLRSALADSVFRVRRRVQFFRGLAHGSVRLERQTHATRWSGKLGSATYTFTEKRSGARHLNPVARQHSHLFDFLFGRGGNLKVEVNCSNGSNFSWPATRPNSRWNMCILVVQSSHIKHVRGLCVAVLLPE